MLYHLTTESNYASLDLSKLFEPEVTTSNPCNAVNTDYPNTPLRIICQVIIKSFNESANETDYKSSNMIL